jgi:hypothetical protein
MPLPASISPDNRYLPLYKQFRSRPQIISVCSYHADLFGGPGDYFKASLIHPRIRLYPLSISLEAILRVARGRGEENVPWYSLGAGRRRAHGKVQRMRRLGPIGVGWFRSLVQHWRSAISFVRCSLPVERCKRSR